MDQWVKEISTKTSPGALKVCSYHGPQRGKRESMQSRLSGPAPVDLKTHPTVAATLHKYDIVVSYAR
jgi:hypothetical protein